MDYSVSSEESKGELPQWRIELSRRLHEIKTKREVSPGSQGETEAGKESAETAGPPVVAVSKPQSPVPEPAPAPQPARRPRVLKPRPEPEKAPAPEVSLPLFQASPAPRPAEAPAPEVSLRTPRLAEASEPRIQERPPFDSAPMSELIDRAVAKQAPATTAPGFDPVDLFTSFTGRRTPASAKLILLSRTLSGLVDLIIVIACAGGFVIAADRMTGIEILDARSLLHYSALLLAIFFLYSIFFLFTATQTIGMMITDLRVVDLGDVRPGIARIASRCGLYVLSLLFAGAGLIWACFDGECRCLHDRCSGTKVIRISTV